MQNLARQSTCSWRLLVSGVFFVLMVGVGMPVWGQGVVAYIDVVNGNKGDFLINGSKKNIHSGRALKKDDLITVKNNSSLTLILNGRTQYITDGSYKVEFVPKVGDGGFFNNVMAWFSDLFNQEYRIRINATKSFGKNKLCKPSPLSIPILNNGNAKLLEGKRQLHVAWAGKPSDYQVQLYQVLNGRNKEVKELDEPTIQKPRTTDCAKLEIQEVKLKTWTFKKGERYKIKITDNNTHQSVEDTFTIVSDSEDPRFDAKFKMLTSAEGSNTKDIPVTLLPDFHLQASWLAQQGNGEWKLEAYQTVVHHNSYSADLVKWGLSLGIVSSTQKKVSSPLKIKLSPQ
jgi:hypothetical protein